MECKDSFRVKNEGAAPRLVSEAEAFRVIEEVKGNCSADGGLWVDVFSWWSGGQRWARNQASMTSDQRDVSVTIRRLLRGAFVSVNTNQLDGESLGGASELIEHYAHRWDGNRGSDMMLERATWNSPGARVWSDVTFDRTPGENGRIVHKLTQRAKAEQLLSAGYLEVGGAQVFKYARDEWGRESNQSGRVTQAQCSVTVRHPLGQGSGWAGNTSFDLDRLDLDQIAHLALDKCQQSLEPVRIEPGRYQTILEPQAAATFFQLLVRYMTRRPPEEPGGSPFTLGLDRAVERFRSKLGLKVVDERITITHNPSDPIVGTHSDPGVDRVTLVNQGVLTNLYNRYSYSVNELVEKQPVKSRTSFYVEGTETTLEEMISSTRRGLLVTRVSQPELIDTESLLYSGLTRDGLWLVENGRISKAVRNFRWTESPLFIFNNIEELGMTAPVFDPTNIRHALAVSFANSLNNISVPACKINDFSFTSTIDAL